MRVIFVQQLVQRRKDVGLVILNKIDADLKITENNDPSSTNPNVHPDWNILEQWIPLAIRSGYAPGLYLAKHLVETVGRMKYLTPVYQALVDSDQTAIAQQWLDDNKSFYDPVAYYQLQRLIDNKPIGPEGAAPRLDHRYLKNPIY